jgi:hypothetical protein
LKTAPAGIMLGGKSAALSRFQPSFCARRETLN